METKLTTRQFEALEAVLYGKAPHYRRTGTDGNGKAWFTVQTNMGGAVSRMVEQLTEQGLITGSAKSRLSDDLGVRYLDLPELPEALTNDKGGLTVEGLEAVRSYLSGRRFDPTDERQRMITEQLAARRELDIAYDAFLALHRNTAKAAFERKREAQRQAANAGTRVALIALGFDASGLTDDQLVQLRRDIDKSVHGLGWVRFLDDADLSAELDQAEKESHRPGTLGSDMRSEKVEALRAEFRRRAGDLEPPRDGPDADSYADQRMDAADTE